MKILFAVAMLFVLFPVVILITVIKYFIVSKHTDINTKESNKHNKYQFIHYYNNHYFQENQRGCLVDIKTNTIKKSRLDKQALFSSYKLLDRFHYTVGSSLAGIISQDLC